MSVSTRGWLREPAASSGRLRLVCFPHAGAGASAYSGWAQLLAPAVRVVSVQLPGREERIKEPRHERLEPLLDALLPELRQEPEVPFAFLGHSMGALIAYEATRRLAEAGAALPVRLFVSGHGAPHLPYRNPHISRLPGEQFLAAVRALNGFPAEVLREPALAALVAPTLRSDFSVCENYRHRPGEPLGCPISVFGGTTDDVWQGDLAQWRSLTSRDFRLRMFSGDHFFIHAERERVIHAIAEDLGVAAGTATRKEQ
ncbi:alpha/beta fold hydrolase [Nonomuraea sp. NPDC049725]|uniref:thioesterase II family protein n=1 Tax=Nonomuraea sp. NPDC049725 TaxID=3154508 RepID=UPI003417D106